jgi:hypothetical protein
MSNMERYKIRGQAQQPIRVNLYDPATGKQTEDWLDVRSSLSDAFSEARDDTMRAVQEIEEPNKEKRAALVSELQLGLKVALVAGWSFDVPFTEQNVREFLREAPQIQQMIMNIADDSSAFFARPSGGSLAGRKKK